MKWFKFDHDLPGSIRVRRLKAFEKWAFVCLLCLASQSEDRGSIVADDEDIADYCDLDSHDWLVLKDKLVTRGLIELGIGGIRICGWDKDQRRKDSESPEAVRERVRRHREAKRNTEVTPCNALQRVTVTDVTPIEKNRSEEEQNRKEKNDFEFSRVRVEDHDPVTRDIPPGMEPITLGMTPEQLEQHKAAIARARAIAKGRA